MNKPMKSDSAERRENMRSSNLGLNNNTTTKHLQNSGEKDRLKVSFCITSRRDARALARAQKAANAWSKPFVPKASAHVAPHSSSLPSVPNALEATNALSSVSVSTISLPPVPLPPPPPPPSFPPLPSLSPPSSLSPPPPLPPAPPPPPPPLPSLSPFLPPSLPSPAGVKEVKIEWTKMHYKKAHLLGTVSRSVEPKLEGITAQCLSPLQSNAINCEPAPNWHLQSEPASAPPAHREMSDNDGRQNDSAAVDLVGANEAKQSFQNGPSLSNTVEDVQQADSSESKPIDKTNVQHVKNDTKRKIKRWDMADDNVDINRSGNNNILKNNINVDVNSADIQIIPDVAPCKEQEQYNMMQMDMQEATVGDKISVGCDFLHEPYIHKQVQPDTAVPTANINDFARKSISTDTGFKRNDGNLPHCMSDIHCSNNNEIESSSSHNDDDGEQANMLSESEEDESDDDYGYRYGRLQSVVVVPFETNSIQAKPDSAFVASQPDLVSDEDDRAAVPVSNVASDKNKTHGLTPEKDIYSSTNHEHSLEFLQNNVVKEELVISENVDLKCCVQESSNGKSGNYEAEAARNNIGRTKVKYAENAFPSNTNEQRLITLDRDIWTESRFGGTTIGGKMHNVAGENENKCLLKEFNKIVDESGNHTVPEDIDAVKKIESCVKALYEGTSSAKKKIIGSQDGDQSSEDDQKTVCDEKGQSSKGLDEILLEEQNENDEKKGDIFSDKSQSFKSLFALSSGKKSKDMHSTESLSRENSRRHEEYIDGGHSDTPEILDRNGKSLACGKSCSYDQGEGRSRSQNQRKSHFPMRTERSCSPATVDRQDESCERVDRHDQSCERVDRHDQSCERVNRQDQSCERVDRQDQSCERVDRQDQSCERVDRQDQSCERVDRQDQSCERVDRQDQSCERVDRQDQSCERVDRQDQSCERVDRQDQSCERVDRLDQSCERVDRQDQSCERVDRQDQSCERVDRQDQSCERVDRQDQSCERVDRQDQSCERVDRQDQSCERVDRQDHSCERVDRQDHSCERMDIQDQSCERMDIQDQSCERMDIQDQSSERMDIQDQSSERMDIQDQSSERMDIQDKSTGRLDSQDQSSGRVDNPDRSSGRVDSPDRSSGRVDSPDQSSGRVDSPDHSSGRVDRPDQSSGRVDRPDQSSERVDRKDQSSERVDRQDQSFERLDRQDQSSERVDRQDQSCERVDRQDQSSERVDIWDQSSERVDRRDQSSERVDRRDQSSERVDRRDQSSERVDRWDQSSERLDRWDQSSHRVDRWDQSSERVDRWDQSSERLDRWDQSSHRLDRWDQSSERVGKWDQSTERVNRWDQSSKRVERRDQSSERVDRQDQSSERVDGQDQSSERVDGQDQSSGRVDRQDRSSERVDRQDRSSERVERQDQSSERVDGQDPSSERVDGQDQSSERVDGQDPSSERVDGQDPSSGRVDGQDPSSERVDGQDPSSERVDGQDPSSERVDGQDPSSERVDGLDHSSARLDGLDQSSARVDRLDQSSDWVDRLDQSSDRLDRLDQSSERVDRLDRSSERADGLDRSSEKADGLDRSSERADGLDHYSERADGLDHSSERADGLDHSSERLDGLDHSSERVDGLDHSSVRVGRLNESSARVERLDQSSERVEKLDQSSKRVERLDQSSERVERLDQTFERVERLDQSSERVERLDQSSERVERLDQSSERVARLDQSSERVARLDQSSERVERQDQSCERVDRQDQSCERVERLDQTFERVERLDQSSERVERLDQSSERVERLDQSSERVERLDQSSERVERLDQSSERVVRLDQSSERVERLDQSSERVERLDQSSERVERLDQSSEMLERLDQSSERVERLDQSSEMLERLDQSCERADRKRSLSQENGDRHKSWSHERVDRQNLSHERADGRRSRSHRMTDGWRSRSRERAGGRRSRSHERARGRRSRSRERTGGRRSRSRERAGRRRSRSRERTDRKRTRSRERAGRWRSRSRERAGRQRSRCRERAGRRRSRCHERASGWRSRSRERVAGRRSWSRERAGRHRSRERAGGHWSRSREKAGRRPSQSRERAGGRPSRSRERAGGQWSRSRERADRRSRSHLKRDHRSQSVRHRERRSPSWDHGGNRSHSRDHRDRQGHSGSFLERQRSRSRVPIYCESHSPFHSERKSHSRSHRTERSKSRGHRYSRNSSQDCREKSSCSFEQINKIIWSGERVETNHSLEQDRRNKSPEDGGNRIQTQEPRQIMSHSRDHSERQRSPCQDHFSSWECSQTFFEENIHSHNTGGKSRSWERIDNGRGSMDKAGQVQPSHSFFQKRAFDTNHHPERVHLSHSEEHVEGRFLSKDNNESPNHSRDRFGLSMEKNSWSHNEHALHCMQPDFKSSISIEKPCKTSNICVSSFAETSVIQPFTKMHNLAGPLSFSVDSHELCASSQMEVESGDAQLQVHHAEKAEQLKCMDNYGLGPPPCVGDVHAVVTSSNQHEDFKGCEAPTQSIYESNATHWQVSEEDVSRQDSKLSTFPIPIVFPKTSLPNDVCNYANLLSTGKPAFAPNESNYMTEFVSCIRQVGVANQGYQHDFPQSNSDGYFLKQQAPTLESPKSCSILDPSVEGQMVHPSMEDWSVAPTFPELQMRSEITPRWNSKMAATGAPVALFNETNKTVTVAESTVQVKDECAEEGSRRRSKRILSLESKKDVINRSVDIPPSIQKKSRGKRKKVASESDSDSELDLVDVQPDVKDQEEAKGPEFEELVWSMDDFEDSQKWKKLAVEGKMPSYFDVLDENQYLSERKRSKSHRDIKKMRCECCVSEEDKEQGIPACGDDCLNRILMIECSSRCPTGEFCTNRRFQKREYARVEVFKTHHKGWGLHTAEDLAAGTFVLEYCGEVLDYKEFKTRAKDYARQKNVHFYFMALKNDEIIDATLKGNCSRFMNHSCEPNCETQKWTVNGQLRVGFFTKDTILVGTELTFDYQFQRYGKEAQKCYCGAATCRGYLGGDNRTSVRSAVGKGQRIKDKDRVRKKESLDEELELSLECFERLSRPEHAVALLRLMVRTDTRQQRLTCLRLLQNTESPACLKNFMDYQGLPLLWSWMVEVGDIHSISSSDAHLQMEIMKTLQHLPIPNKTLLLKSRVLSIIERWSQAGMCHVPVSEADGDSSENASAALSALNSPAPSDQGKLVESTYHETPVPAEQSKTADVGSIDNTTPPETEAGAIQQWSTCDSMSSALEQSTNYLEKVADSESAEALPLHKHLHEIGGICQKSPTSVLSDGSKGSDDEIEAKDAEGHKRTTFLSAVTVGTTEAAPGNLEQLKGLVASESEQNAAGMVADSMKQQEGFVSAHMELNAAGVGSEQTGFVTVDSPVAKAKDSIPGIVSGRTEIVSQGALQKNIEKEGILANGVPVKRNSDGMKDTKTNINASVLEKAEEADEIATAVDAVDSSQVQGGRMERAPVGTLSQDEDDVASDVESEQSHEPLHSMPLSIGQLAAKLLDNWKDLKEVYRIPKRIKAEKEEKAS
uniref:uncharacterized protein isoform X2 n=1 Tax=Myxine glutinosa TaxID=7769 RepID=UPI00358EA22A